MRRCLFAALVALSLLFPSDAWASSVDVVLHRIDAEGIGETIGTVTASDTDQGLVITPNLQGLSAGEYGFHLHSNGSCDPGRNADGVSIAGLKAGGHWDPDETGTHEGPFGQGHRGDLSRLVVEADASTITAVVAPRLVADDLGVVPWYSMPGETPTPIPPRRRWSPGCLWRRRPCLMI